MEIVEAASDTSVPPSRDGSPSSKTRNPLSQASQLPASEASGDAPAAAPDPVTNDAPAHPVHGEAPAPPEDGEIPTPPVDGEAPAPPEDGETASSPGEAAAPPAADEVPAPPAISDEAPAPPAAADEATAPAQEPTVDPAQDKINPELFQATLTATGDGAAPSEASAEVPYGSPRALGRSGSGSSRIPPSPPANFSQRPSRTPLQASPSLSSPSLTYDGSPRVAGSIPSVGSIIGGPSGSTFTGAPPGPIQVEATSPRRSKTAPAAATPAAARSKPPNAPAPVLEQPPPPLQRRASSNSMPIRPIVEPAIHMMARGKHRPVVMPFVERHATVGMAGGGPGGGEARGSFKAPPAHAAGRRAGPQGAIRLGAAHSTPMPQASGVSSMTAASSGPRDMHGRVRRPDQDTLMHHSSSMTASAMPVYRHSPGSSNDGADDTLPAPPLLPAASREWERGRGGYAAGGGAAAVKAATAAAAASIPHTVNPAEQQLHQQLMLGEAVHIRSIRKANMSLAAERTVTSSNMTAGVAGVGVPGRRGRRVAARPGGTSSATAAAMAAYFASVEASIADGTAPDQMLLPSGLARRLKAARMMASGPPPFQRRKESPPPPSPTGIKLDGFMLLEAADEEMPEAVQAAVLSARHISAVESADLSYFVALRSLDVSDNKLPDLVCLAPLAALVRLRVAACRLSSLGRWPGQTVEPPAAAAAAVPVPVPAPATTTTTASSSGTGGGGGASGPLSVVARAKSRLAAAAGAGSGTGNARPGSTEQGSGRLGTGSTAAATAEGDPRGTTPESLQQPWLQYTDSGVAAPSPAGTDSLSEPAGAMDAIAAAAAAFAVAGADVQDMSSVLLPGPASGLALPLPPFQYLEVLDLSFNQLQPHMVLLPNCPLARLPRLTELDLSCNRFKRLPSPAEIRAAAAAAGVNGAAASGAPGVSRPSLAATAAATGPAFPALRRLRLADNGLTSGALASIAALAPPCLTHLDLSRNAIAEAPAPHLLALDQPAAPHGPSPLSSGFSSTPPTQASRKGPLTQSQQAPHAVQAQPHQRQPSPQSQFSAASASTLVSSATGAVSLSGYLVRLAVLDLTYNRVTSEAAVAPLLTLPSLQRLLLAGNPIVVSLQRSDAEATRSRVIDLGEPDAMPPKPSVAASLTARFARIAEAAPKQHASTLAAAAAAVITSATAPERVTEVFDRTDATIEQWRLNTVMEEDEEDDEDEDGYEMAPDDRTFLTGVGITDSMRHKASGTNSTIAQDSITEPSGGELDDEETEPVGGTPPAQSLGATSVGEERPLWESISDPTERLAVALGLDPLSLPIHTGALTTDAAGAIAALRFALAHPLVEANAGLGPHPGYIATTTAAQLKRKPRRAPAPAALARLAPMGTAAAAGPGPSVTTGSVGTSGIHSPKTVKIQTMEALLEGMKGKLAALEASLTVQLAAAPPPPPAGKMSPFGRKQGRSRRRARRARDSDSDDDDDDSSGSGLPDDVIDQIERESGSEDEDKRAVEEEMGPLDPREGLVLVADQIITDDSSMDPRVLHAALSRDPSGASPLSRATTVTLLPSTFPNSRSTQLPPSPTRTNSSPLRGSVNASATSVAPGSRKGGVSGGPHVVPATPVTLPGGAASALGYAA